MIIWSEKIEFCKVVIPTIHYNTLLRLEGTFIENKAIMSFGQLCNNLLGVGVRL